MNVGFRPRLKARPSLYDLIRNRNIDSLSVAVHRRPSLSQELHPELPPLPPSPSFTTCNSPPPPSTPRTPQPVQVEYQPSVKMPPKKAAIKDDDDEQYGRPLLINWICHSS